MKKNNKIWFILFLIITSYVFFRYVFSWKIFEHFDSGAPRIAIISAIFGGYDEPKEQNINDKNLADWYLMTDSSNNVSGWNVITQKYHLENTPPNEDKNNYNNITETSVYNMMSAKYYKCQTHHIDILRNYDYYVWVDASVELKPDFMKNIMEIIHKDKSLANFRHGVRTTVKDEITESMKSDRYKEQKVEEQYKMYVADKFPDNLGLYELTMFIRKNNTTINTLFDDWWQHNLKYSYQDQISYPYVLWKHKMKPDYVIEQYVADPNNDFGVRKTHAPPARH
jgi:hypothetical protein